MAPSIDPGGLRPRRAPGASAPRRPVIELLRLLPQASAWGTVGFLVLVLVAGLLPVAVMLATGALVAAVGGQPPPLPGIHSAWAALALIAALFVLLRVIGPFMAPVVDHLGYRLELAMRERMLRAVLRPPTIAHLEDPQLADELAQARTVGTEQVQATQVIEILAAIASSRLLAVSSAVVLAGFRWWAPVVLAAVWAVSNQWYRRESARMVSSLGGSTASFRRARYSSDLALGGAAAKEIRIFGLAPWLADRFERQWRAGMHEAWARRGGLLWALALSAGCLLAGHALVLGLLARSAARGTLGIGPLTIYAQAILAMAGLGWDPDSQYLLRLGIAPLSHVLSLCAAADGPRFRLPGSGAAACPRAGIRFEAVSFSYPGTGRTVLRDLDLWLPAGRSLAIVGDNGSGKTTMLKLLCRFYDPTGGRITVDGGNLAELEAAAWQRRVGAVFQDFAHYPLPARDNVAFGDLQRRGDEQALHRAAASAGIADLIEQLPGGWDTPLSRQFPGGTEPSGGQWQRLALARVLFAVEGGAGVLILDEPTANLDIRAEAAFYDRFLDLTRGLTTVVVSHRFSTVRRADHIVVLDGGRVVEEGSHAELIALGGRYAAMFELQAAPYREAAGA